MQSAKSSDFENWAYGKVGVGIPDESGQMALFSAVLKKRNEIAPLLLQHFANVNYGEMDETVWHRVENKSSRRGSQDPS
jgi:hypothetical protein